MPGDTINSAFHILEQFKIEQDIFQVIGMAFLTILIPVAIVILDRREYNILDRNITLDYIIKGKYFLIHVGLLFLPLLFWNISPFWLRLIELILWIIGVYFMIKILSNSYNWLKGNRFKLRLDYLRKLKNYIDIENAWHSIWSKKKLDYLDEREFLNIFITIIDKHLKNDIRYF